MHSLVEIGITIRIRDRIFMLKSGIFHCFHKPVLTSIWKIETSNLVYILIVHSSFIYVAGLVVSCSIQEQRASAGLACLIQKPSLPLSLMGAGLVLVQYVSSYCARSFEYIVFMFCGWMPLRDR